MVAPTSQKDRPISFVLSDLFAGETKSVPLVIRPEELTRSEPALITPQQTLGGAFLDDFGPGLQTISISGHTGWRGNDHGDGGQAFHDLRDTIWTGFHARRTAAVKAGQSPDKVKLIFADSLNKITATVYPGAFTLRRSRSRPLLYMYQISLTVLSDTLDFSLPDTLDLSTLPDPGKMANALDSLDASVSSILDKINGGLGFVDPALRGNVGQFLSTGVAAFGSVSNAIKGSFGTDAVASLVSAATRIAMGGRNLLYTLGGANGLGSDALFGFASLGGEFENVLCLLANALSSGPTYPDYSSVHGSSTCSSTISDSPLSPYAGLNTFAAILPGASPPPSISADANAALQALQACDPVLAPLSSPTLGVLSGQVAAGVRFG